jgi:hypothetical protein
LAISYQFAEGRFADNFEHCLASYAGIKPESFYEACQGPMFFTYVLVSAAMIPLTSIMAIFLNPPFALLDPAFDHEYPWILAFLGTLLDIAVVRLLLIYPSTKIRNRLKS